MSSPNSHLNSDSIPTTFYSLLVPLEQEHFISPSSLFNSVCALSPPLKPTPGPIVQDLLSTFISKICFQDLNYLKNSVELTPFA
jgi:hypothetical protein